MTALACDLVECPLATEGRCLEGFADAASCPHTQASALTNEVGNARQTEDTDGARADLDARHQEDEDREEQDEDESLGAEPIARTTWVHLGGDEALTLEDADDIAQQSPCRVVLIAGEFESGKTTLVVELYAQFLKGPFAEANFGGSRTLRALDRLHHPARADSGGTTPTTERTAQTDMRLLHLRLRRHGRVHDLLLSDVWGEFFENIVDGAEVANEVPLAQRADVCLVAVDGAALAKPAEQQVAISRARALVGGLTEQGGLPGTTPIAILATKSDLLNEEARAWAGSQLESVRQLAESRGRTATTLFVAARPPTTAAPEGLEVVLDHVLPPRRPVSALVVAPSPGDRQFWAQPDVQL